MKKVELQPGGTHAGGRRGSPREAEQATQALEEGGQGASGKSANTRVGVARKRSVSRGWARGTEAGTQ
eukprot:847093-Alexandrium_andersonii.AAC.1